MNNRFPKSERISSKRAVEDLFSSGKTIKEFPFSVRYILFDSEEGETNVLISVPKRRFKKAVDRNRVKRLIRESYRLNKSELVLPKGKGIMFAFIYLAPEIREFNDLQRRIVLTLRKLSEHINH